MSLNFNAISTPRLSSPLMTAPANTNVGQTSLAPTPQLALGNAASPSGLVNSGNLFGMISMMLSMMTQLLGMLSNSGLGASPFANSLSNPGQTNPANGDSTGGSATAGTAGTGGTAGTSGTNGPLGMAGTAGTGGTSGTAGQTGASNATNPYNAPAATGKPNCGCPHKVGTPTPAGTTATGGTPGTPGAPATPGTGGTGSSQDLGSAGTTGQPGTAGTAGTTGTPGTVVNPGTADTAGVAGSPGVANAAFSVGKIPTLTNSNVTNDGSNPISIFNASDYKNFLLAGSQGGTKGTDQGIFSRFADPNSRFAHATNDQFQAAIAGMYANQFKGYALGLDVAYEPGKDINALSNNLVKAGTTRMTPEAEMLSKVAALYRGNLTGPNLYNNAALKNLLVQWGRTDIANKPFTGSQAGDVQSIGGVIQALNEQPNSQIRQQWLQQVFDFAGNTPKSPSGAVPNLPQYQKAISMVRDNTFNTLLNGFLANPGT